MVRDGLCGGKWGVRRVCVCVYCGSGVSKKSTGEVAPYPSP